ncbi:MAG: DUF1028 domain-containing protein [Chloroflexi bacterium]|nr:DUF1028 domain-containing protein [Chloroflexota bacterium]
MTYSIVAYDPETKQFGVGVQTHQPSVGAVVPWVRAGVGAVATQSLTNIAFGPMGIELMAQGYSAEEGDKEVHARERRNENRQLPVTCWMRERFIFIKNCE